MGPVPKIEHHYMKAMLYKILKEYGQSQNKLTLPQAYAKFEQNSHFTNKVQI